MLAEEFSLSQGKVSREEVTQEGKNIRHSAPAQGAGLSWLAASRMCELRDRAIPFRETQTVSQSKAHLGCSGKERMGQRDTALPSPTTSHTTMHLPFRAPAVSAEPALRHNPTLKEKQQFQKHGNEGVESKGREKASAKQTKC